ncbi:MAG: hypothetical protein GX607_12470 [Myxococcales bacterium]|nr:hypothetical protein [Myxococcales bacterium]
MGGRADGGQIAKKTRDSTEKSRATLRKLGFFKRRTSGPDEEPIEVADLGEPSATEPDTDELDGQPEARQLAEPVTE